MSIYHTLIVQELKQSLFNDIMFNQESRVYYLIKKLGHILLYVTGEYFFSKLQKYNHNLHFAISGC